MQTDRASRSGPNLFVIGAQRAGSTSMWRYLRSHPEIFMAKAKEPGFLAFAGGLDMFSHLGDPGFVDQTVLDEEAYFDLFAEGADVRYRGESTSFYLYFDEAQAELQRRFPDAKLIIVLRDPIDRIWSSFSYLRRLGGEPLTDLGDALDAEPMRIAENWEPLFHYVAESRYSEQLTRLYERFDRSQVFVTVLERLERDGQQEMRRLFEWLGVEPDVDVGGDVVHNSAGASRLPLVNTILSPGWLPSGLADRIPTGVKDWAVKLREANRRSDYDELPEPLRQRLRAELATEIDQLPALLDFDPSDHWLTFQKARR